MTFQRKKLGESGEKIAGKYLINKGYKIIGRNVRLRVGEIDIIAQDGDYIVLVEIKTKTRFDQGRPEEMVNWHKAKKLRLLSRAVIKDYPNKNLRIDVVAVDKTSREPKINHIISAVEG